MSSRSYKRMAEDTHSPRTQRRQIVVRPDVVNAERTQFEFRIPVGTVVDKMYIPDNTFKRIEAVSISGCKILPIMLKGTMVNDTMLYTVPLGGYDRQLISNVVIDYVDPIERGEPCLIIDHLLDCDMYKERYEDCLTARYMNKSTSTYEYKLQGDRPIVLLYKATIAIPKHQKSVCKHIRAKLVGKHETVILAETMGITGLVASQQYDELLRSLDNPNKYDLYTLEIAEYKHPTFRYNGDRIVIEADISAETDTDDLRPVVILSMGSVI